MKCHIERDAMSGLLRVKVWLWQEGPRQTHSLRLREDGEWWWEEVPNGGLRPEPTLVLSDDMLEALVRAAENVVPASDATTAHLKDAQTVRDRLLTIVEKEHGLEPGFVFEQGHRP